MDAGVQGEQAKEGEDVERGTFHEGNDECVEAQR